MAEMLKKGDLFKGSLVRTGKQYVWRVDDIMHDVTEAQINGQQVDASKWKDDDPRWDEIKFVLKPIDPYLVNATRLKIEKSGRSAGQIVLYGHTHAFVTNRGADAPRRCTRVSASELGKSR